MSEATNVAAKKSSIQMPLPMWLSAGVIGLALGTGATIVVMHNVGYRMGKPESTTQSSSQGGGGGGGGMGGGMPGMGGGGGGGGGMMMGMGGGGGGSMGAMMGGGGGGGARGKRTLTSLVGKLELLTRGNLHVELDPDQTSKIAAKLAEWDEVEKMTADDAQGYVDALEAILTDDQKSALDSIGLPFGRPGGGAGGPGGGGPMGGGGGMMGMGGGAGGGSGDADDDNPFRQESNQKRLRDLLNRLQPSKGEPSSSP